MLHWCVHRCFGHDETQHCTKVIYQLCGKGMSLAHHKIPYSQTEASTDKIVTPMYCSRLFCRCNFLQQQAGARGPCRRSTFESPAGPG